MSQRLAALQALFESGQQHAEDASVDQSVTTYPAATDAVRGLDSSTSLDVSPAPTSSAQALLSPANGMHTSTNGGSPMISEQMPEHSGVDGKADGVNADQEPSHRHTPKRHSLSLLLSESNNQGATPRMKATKSNTLTQENDATAHSVTATPVANDTSATQNEESSLSASLGASQLGRSRGALEFLDEDDEVDGPANESASTGHWGVQEMRRRTAAGISIKSTLQKIDQLTAERDDLKIEVDFHRRNMSPEDVGAEVITLRQEKLGYVRRLQKMNELVKSQDQALKTVNRQVKSWEAKMLELDVLQEQLRTAEERARQAEAACANTGRQECADHEHQIHRLERLLHAAKEERDAMHDELDAMRLNESPDLHEAIQHRDNMIQDLRAELADAQTQLEQGMPSDNPHQTAQFQQQLEEQHETICSLQDALAAERLVVAEKEGEMDRLEGHVEAAEATATDLQRQLEMRRDSEEAALADAQRLHTRVAQLARELEDARSVQESRIAALQDKLAISSAQAEELHATMEQQATQRMNLEDLNARLNAKLVELVKDLKDEEHARERADTNWSQRYDTNEAQTRRAIATKDTLIESLESQLVQLRQDKQQHTKAMERLQETLRTSEQVSQRQMDEVNTHHKRELDRLTDDLNEKLSAWHDAQDEVTRLRAEMREMANSLQSETRARLGAQDRLESVQRALDGAKHEMERMREQQQQQHRGLSSPRTGNGGSSVRGSDTGARIQIAERNALLTAVFDTLARALQDDMAPGESRLVHTNFHAFHDKLTQRLRRLSNVQAWFVQRSSAMEKEHLHKLAYVGLLGPPHDHVSED